MGLHYFNAAKIVRINAKDVTYMIHYIECIHRMHNFSFRKSTTKFRGLQN